MQRAAQSRNEQAQAEAALAGLETRGGAAGCRSRRRRGASWRTLGVQRGQVAMTFGDVTERLKRLETEIAELRLRIAAARAQERRTKRRGDQLRARARGAGGRRSSLESLIREHSYSTDTVRNIFKANAQRQQQWIVAGGNAGGFS